MKNHNLYALFAENFPADRTACAIETEAGGLYSWDDIEQGSACIANLLLSSGLPAGTRVAVQVEKSVEALLLYLATLRAGYVHLPLNTAYREDEIAYFLGNARPGLVVCASSEFSWVSRIAFAQGARQVFTLDPDRTGSLLERASALSRVCETAMCQNDTMAAILYTSGTTGRSKGAMLTHGNLSSNAKVLKQFWHWSANDVLLHALPLFHVHGLFVAAHGALLSGSKMIFMNRFEPAQVVAALRRATVFMGVPTFYTRLLADPRFDRAACARMRLFVSGSAPLLAETFEAFEKRTGHTILERYGMSETAMLVSNPYEGPRVAGTVGVALPTVSIRVVDGKGVPVGIGEVGQIQVQGPNVFAGYWEMPEKTREEFTTDRFFKTGDLGQWREVTGSTSPYLSIVGRSKDLIITGGYNVYPKEIEAVLDELPGVLESAVIGVDHADFGEAVTAVLVMRGEHTLSEATVIAALKGRIANFKIPKRVHFLDDLPRNTMGKVQKNLLRQKFSKPA